jgi:hypothetical protein
MMVGGEPEDDLFGPPADSSPPPLPDLAARIELLDILVRVELATQEAYQLGFAPGPEELGRLEANAVEAAGGAKALERALAETGSDMGQFRNQLARNGAMKSWRDAAFLARARVTEEEARAFYDAHRDETSHGDESLALQIMFPLPVLETPQARESRERIRRRAEEALRLAKSGRDFEELMGVYMDSTVLAAIDGGQLGWVSPTGTFPELEEVIFSLKPGEVGGPVETPFSIHIVKVVDTRKAGTLTFQELRPEINEMLTESRIDAFLQERSDELMREAEVIVLDPELAPAWDEFRRTGAVPSAPPDPGDGAGSPAGPEAPDGAADGAAPAAGGEAESSGTAASAAGGPEGETQPAP